MRIQLVAALSLAAVLLLAACGGGEDPNVSADGGDGAAGATLTVTAGDLFFEPPQLDAVPGTVTIELVNDGAAQHTFVIEEEAGDTTVADAAAGATDTGSIELEAGTYTFYCDVPGHREGGMEGTLTVG